MGACTNKSKKKRTKTQTSLHQNATEPIKANVPKPQERAEEVSSQKLVQVSPPPEQSNQVTTRSINQEVYSTNRNRNQNDNNTNFNVSINDEFDSGFNLNNPYSYRSNSSNNGIVGTNSNPNFFNRGINNNNGITGAINNINNQNQNNPNEDSDTNRTGHFCNRCQQSFHSLMNFQQHFPFCQNSQPHNDFQVQNSLNEIFHLVQNLNNHLMNPNMLALLGLNEADEPKEYFDWQFNKQNKIWYNKGKKILTESDLQKFGKMSMKEVLNQHFYIKRIWFNQYINKNVYDKMNDNSPLVVSRENILEESYNQFMTSKDLNLHGNMHIFFVDEVAYDVGGVYREWYSCLFGEIFSTKNPFFVANKNKGDGIGTYLIPIESSQTKFSSAELLSYYEFIGKVIGKALFDKITVQFHLNKIIIKHLMGDSLSSFTLEDLKYYDSDIFKSLSNMLSSTMKNNTDLFFDWEVEGKTIELKPNGSKILITEENKQEFVSLLVKYLCYEAFKDKIDAFKSGFKTILGEETIHSALKIFSVEEFDFFLSGQNVIDLEDWKKNTFYRGYYTENYPTIRLFWEVLRELSKEELLGFYKFCTGSATVPVDGFGSLQGTRNRILKFCIESPSDKEPINVEKTNRLIEAKTCFNRICLPDYDSKEKMKKAIFTILSNDTEFFGMK